MIQELKNQGRLHVSILLIVMSLFCFGISITRYFLTYTNVFLFLNWNLFLAFIPWLLSTFLILKGVNRKLSLFVLIVTWLLFFPNSPYILTDLFHLRMNSSAPIWFDLVVILSFAWTGLMFGFVSLMDISTLLKKYFSNRTISIIIVFFLFISSFGIYLGRYLRWNSWDILRNPFGLFNDIADRFVNPFSHPRTWGMTLLMGVLLNMIFFSIKLLTTKKQSS